MLLASDDPEGEAVPLPGTPFIYCFIMHSTGTQRSTERRH